MAAAIEMPFGMPAWVGPNNHVLDEDPDPPDEGAILRLGRGRPIVKCRNLEVSAAERQLS